MEGWYDGRSILERRVYYKHLLITNNGPYSDLFGLEQLVSIMLFTTTFCLMTLSLPLHANAIDYKKAWTTKGDKIPNFSFAGYHQSEGALPSLSTSAKKTLSPGSGDQHPAIQAALDEVFQDGGGVVALKAGTYPLSSGLLIQNGTTLRGAGIGKTILTVKNLREDVVTLGVTSGKEKRKESIKITDDYVPAGTGTVHVTDASGLSVGMEVYVERGVTQKWIDKLGMTAHTGEDRNFTWLKVTCCDAQDSVYT